MEFLGKLKNFRHKNFPRILKLLQHLTLKFGQVGWGGMNFDSE